MRQRQLIAAGGFARRYNETWFVARHGYKSEQSKRRRNLRLTNRSTKP